MVMRTISKNRDPEPVNDSVFKQRMDDIRARFGNEFDEETNKQRLMATLEMLDELIPIAETNYRKYKIDKAAYTLSTLVSQQREAVNDLRALQSFSDRSDRIKDIIRESIKLNLQNLLDSVTLLNETLGSKLAIEGDMVKQNKLKTVLQEFLSEHSRYMFESVKLLEDQIDGYIVKTPHIPRAKKILTKG